MRFSHFVITQFNLRNFTKTDITFEQWVEWTRKRISLFKEFCLPSMVGQTSKKFTWLIYFDEDTPVEFSSFLDYLSQFDFIAICYSNGLDDFSINYMKEVKTRTHVNDLWIMTTRLDNDDLLHCKAIEIIQSHFAPTNGYLISLASGYVMDLSNRKMAHYFYPMSPFITLVEQNSIKSVGIFYRLHTKWPNLRLFIFKELYLEFINPTQRESRFVLKQPLWIQLCHGNNVSNNFFRGLPVIKQYNLSNFGSTIATVKMKMSEFTKFANYVIWKRYLKCWIIKILVNM